VAAPDISGILRIDRGIANRRNLFSPMRRRTASGRPAGSA
jgi:hypothetical protein